MRAAGDPAGRTLGGVETEEMDATTERTASPERDESEPVSTHPPTKLDALYVQCMPEAVGLGYLLTGDREVAEEIGDEAFVRGAGRFEHRLGRVRYPTWLRRSVVTVFLLRERRAELEQVEPGTDEAATEAPSAVWAAVLSLPPRERAAVVLRHCRGLSDEEVGESLRCGVRTARATVARGLAMLEDLRKERPEGQ
jgi:RNA polymerase sigma factor (sigma-70 family)